MHPRTCFQNDPLCPLKANLFRSPKSQTRSGLRETGSWPAARTYYCDCAIWAEIATQRACAVLDFALNTLFWVEKRAVTLGNDPRLRCVPRSSLEEPKSGESHSASWLTVMISRNIFASFFPLTTWSCIFSSSRGTFSLIRSFSTCCTAWST